MLPPKDKAIEILIAIRENLPPGLPFKYYKGIAFLWIDEIITAVNATGRMVKTQLDYWGDVKLEINAMYE